MITYFKKRHNSLPYRILSAFIAFNFTFSLILPPGYAQLIPQTVLNLPAPGTMVTTSAAFTPALINGITIHPENPLEFDFIVGTGDQKLEGKTFEEESTRLIKYFLASLTVPEDQMWVNLSPYEKDRIVPQGFGTTEMGRDLLAQDYILKQLTASLMYPEKELGSAFWKKIYQKAYEQYGTTEIPMNTFNKVWIIPQQAVVYEHGNSAFVVKSHLKVMLEEDYMAASHQSSDVSHQKSGESDHLTTDDRRLTTQVIREIILPAIEKEVNEGQTFANLRQIYNSVILAAWFKQNLRQTLLGQVYVDKTRTKGVDVEDKEVNQKIYAQYLEAFKKGVYNYIKEDTDPATKEVIPRKYFSGGTNLKVGDLVRTYKNGQTLTRAEQDIVGEFLARQEDYNGGIFNINLVELSGEQSAAEVQNTIAASRAASAERLAANNASSPVTRVAINGAGRIGVNTLRAWLQSPYDIDVVGINDISFNFKQFGINGLKSYVEDILSNEFASAPRSRAQDAKISYDTDGKNYWLIINGKRIRVTDEKDPSSLPWAELNVDVVLESTGVFTTAEAAAKHKNAGAKKVIITAPGTGDLLTVVAGVNSEVIAPEQAIYSCASCTTGSIAPPLKVLLEKFGIEKFVMVTTHSYTSDQFPLDGLRPKAPQRGRAAAENIIYTSTGAAKAIGEVIPELKGKGDGYALRVPTPNGSVTSITITVQKPTTVAEVNRVLREAAEGPLKGIMAFSDKDLVSKDILGRSESSIIQGTATRVIDGTVVNILSWYDNEFGYANRVMDLAALITSTNKGAEKSDIVQRPIPPAVLAQLEKIPEINISAGLLSEIFAGDIAQSQADSVFQEAVDAKRKPIVGYNMKGELLTADVDAFLEGIAADYKADPVDMGRVDVVALFAEGDLKQARAKIDQLVQAGAIPGGFIKLGAQNIRVQDRGAYTAHAPSVKQVQDWGVEVVLLGHSEIATADRGEPSYVESDELIAQKIEAVVKAGLRPIVAYGETRSENDAGLTEEVLTRQLKVRLSRVTGEQMIKNNLVLAYEPVWAIGAGAKPATPQDAEKYTRLSRRIVFSAKGPDVAAQVPIQYGGSMSAENVGVLSAQPDIDGGLIGGASKKWDTAAPIYRTFAQKQAASSPVVNLDGFPRFVKTELDKIQAAPVIKNSVAVLAGALSKQRHFFPEELGYTLNLFEDTVGQLGHAAGENGQDLLTYAREVSRRVGPFMPEHHTNVVLFLNALSRSEQQKDIKLGELKAIQKFFTDLVKAYMSVESGRTATTGGDYTPGAASSPVTSDERRATNDEVGGINLNPELLDLQIKRDGSGVPLPLPMQPIKDMHIEGFLPVIINVTPITNLPLLLGIVYRDLPTDSADSGAQPLELGFAVKEN